MNIVPTSALDLLHRYSKANFALLCASTLGCAIHVTPPLDPAEPVSVFIADYGYHAGLLLPRASGGMAEFAYGQWDWYALNKDEWYRAVPTVLLPSQGALGTRHLRPPPTAESIRRQIDVTELHELKVERPKVESLLAELDAYWTSVQDRAHYNPTMDLHFVPDSDRYCLCCHCNNRVAAWLRKLGCEVTECSMMAEFRIHGPN